MALTEERAGTTFFLVPAGLSKDFVSPAEAATGRRVRAVADVALAAVVRACLAGGGCFGGGAVFAGGGLNLVLGLGEVVV